MRASAGFRCFALCTGMLCSALPVSAQMHTVTVSDSPELAEALKNAKAGDEIILTEGVYQADASSGTWKAFHAEADGTAEAHIILRSADPAHPAEICGNSAESKCALYITGSFWELRDLKVSTACKGIFLAQSEHSIISGCEVCEIGDEAIHIIDDSSYNLIENCIIHDTGLKTPKYGEGVYIGSAKNATDYGFECHYNTVRGCRFGPNIAADHVDIKEYTYGNTVEYCTFDGTGIMGENGGDSFVEVKGNDAVIRFNTGYRNGCEKQTSAFDMNVQLEGWGQGTKIYDNTLYLDTADCYVVKGWNCYAEVFRNKVEPADCVCSGNQILQIDDIRLTGDANGDGKTDAEDVRTLQAFLLGEAAPYLSLNNADLSRDGKLHAADLSLLKRLLLFSDAEQKPIYAVHFEKEDAGKWRMTDGLSERTLTFTLAAEPAAQMKLGWGCWDPNYSEDGKDGKWFSYSLGSFTADENGEVQISVDVPKDCRRTALEVWGYSGTGGNTDKDTVTLKSAVIG